MLRSVRPTPRTQNPATSREAVRAVAPDERGMTTAEYAIGTVAAASFAALLIAILTSDEVQRLLMQVIRSALSLGG